MIVRVLGIGLLILVSIPFVVAFPPLAAVPLLFLLFWPRGRKGKASGRPRSSGNKGRKSRSTRPKRAVSAKRRSPSRGGGPGHWLVLLAIGGLVLAVLARENPAVAAAGLAGLGLLLWRRFRRPRRAMQPASHSFVGGKLSSLSTVDAGTGFELHVQDLLPTLGYRQVWHNGGSGDNGIDLIAEDRQGRTFLVQCKRFTTGKVGSVDIQKLLGAVVHHGASGGIFVTTSGYTPAAVKLATSGRIPITLLDGNDVARLSRRAS